MTHHRHAAAAWAAMTVAAVALVATLLAALSPVARADDAKVPVDVGASARLDVSVGHDGHPIPGMRFDLFRVGDMSEDGSATPYERFADVLPTDMLASSHVPSSAIGEVTRRCDEAGDAPVATGVTDGTGNLTLGGEDGVPVGLYVVVGRDAKSEDREYSVLPFLAWLPQWDGEAGQWLYWVVAAPKPEAKGETEPTGVPGADEPKPLPATQAQVDGNPIVRAIGDLIQTGRGWPFLAGAVLLAATVIELAVAAWGRRKSQA